MGVVGAVGGGWLVGCWVVTGVAVVWGGGAPLLRGALPLARYLLDAGEGSRWPPVGSPRSRLPAVQLVHRAQGCAGSGWAVVLAQLDTR